MLAYSIWAANEVSYDCKWNPWAHDQTRKTGPEETQMLHKIQYSSIPTRAKPNHFGLLEASQEVKNKAWKQSKCSDNHVEFHDPDYLLTLQSMSTTFCSKTTIFTTIWIASGFKEQGFMQQCNSEIQKVIAAYYLRCHTSQDAVVRNIMMQMKKHKIQRELEGWPDGHAWQALSTIHNKCVAIDIPRVITRKQQNHGC